MNAHSVALVQESFEKVAPLGDKVPQIFYDELFTLDPSLRTMFKSDMTEQRKMVFTALGMVVRSLHRPEAIVEPVKALGKRHAGYGVKPAHFPIVGAALLNTLQKGLGDEFTPELRQAWTEAYAALSGMMKEAAYGSANAS